jgi:signal transduction histidine kinase
MLAAVPSLAELSESFNTLATELGNTEMLRSDFINDFSHEFKTPIVSIVGFARLLKSDQLTEEERRQYIQAIEEESMRLSLMSTNILNLTKVENQTILNEVSEFNLSEQIRSCILLLEKEWDNKALELQVDFDEYTVTGNEELLKQVWINLIGNAIKFTPRCGTVSVDIHDEGENIKVDVSNTGSEIPRDKIEKIWTKFYQADESHSTDGNGIGLPIVKRIVELHSGSVSVKSENCITVFSVVIPKNVAK